MGRRLYVGNLPYAATEEQLTELFSRAGKVDNVRVMRDMATGRARGFAFVEMGSDEDAQKAISEFHTTSGRASISRAVVTASNGGCESPAYSAAINAGRLRKRTRKILYHKVNWFRQHGMEK